MDVSAETRGSRSVDLAVNLVPFIDLMSCLVAFLLVTAVWSNLSQMRVNPKGQGLEGSITPQPVELAVLVARDSLWVGLSTGDRRQLGGHDFAALGGVLDEYRAAGVLAGRRDIEIAAEDGVPYQQIISAMDEAIGRGFADVGFVDPASLSVRFRQ